MALSSLSLASPNINCIGHVLDINPRAKPTTTHPSGMTPTSWPEKAVWVKGWNGRLPGSRFRKHTPLSRNRKRSEGPVTPICKHRVLDFLQQQWHGVWELCDSDLSNFVTPQPPLPVPSDLVNKVTTWRSEANLPVNEKYRLREVIGKGSSGSVHRASDLADGREVAVKMEH
ncbi:hypothetical protein L210DRAFT_3503956 [Boletus edulis BED1]|uniref:Protein kinase domain-containing protein n=1 Tax=Boletus edulis BED1 TaxID=1328754 RepID=A0AAD4GEE3_BOLED|nr:hypothetical protein L210DRAFT_3503956 [Boletus edulis BED1]